MNERLPRLKPNPLPEIRVTPEMLAAGQLRAVYQRTKAGLGVPWMGVVAMAFARYPAFYEALWGAIEPIARTRVFHDACARLRAAAEAEAERLNPVPQQASLEVDGYNAGDIAEIRDCLEIFSVGNMPYLLMATLARLLLEEHRWPAGGEPGAMLEQPSLMPRPALMEPQHADPTIRAVYDDIRRRLGLPFVNTDYRALARWPSYFASAWSGLAPVVESELYHAAVERVHDVAVKEALALPNLRALDSATLIAAADQDADINQVLAVVQLFQWLLPGLITNVGWLRGQVRARESDHQR